MANREARRIVGEHAADARAAHDLRGLTCRRVDGSKVAFEDLPVVRAVHKGETVQAEELVIRRPDGSEVTTLVNATPIRSDDGELVSVVATLQDMTPLQDLERLRADFLATVSHELRAPLTSIKGAAATVRDSSIPLDSAEVGQFFGLIEDQADHMRDLINGLLGMTSAEAAPLRPPSCWPASPRRGAGGRCPSRRSPSRRPVMNDDRQTLAIGMNDALRPVHSAPSCASDQAWRHRAPRAKASGVGPTVLPGGTGRSRPRGCARHSTPGSR